MGKRSRPRNWKRLFDKQRFELHAGRDYDISQSSIVQSVRNAAVRHGVLVSPVDKGDHVVVFVRRRSAELFPDSSATTAVTRNLGERRIGPVDGLPAVRARD